MSCTPRLPAVEELDPAQTLDVPDAAVADDSACGVYATYQRLRDENPGLLAPTPVRYADGTLAYLRGLLPRPGALANRVAVMANNCRITTLDDAEAEYLANHRAVWGDIAVESAWDIVHEPLTGPLDFFVWMPARPFDPEPLLEQVRAVVGNARLMTQPSILFFTATVEQAVAISDFEGVNVIILDWAPPVGRELSPSIQLACRASPTGTRQACSPPGLTKRSRRTASLPPAFASEFKRRCAAARSTRPMKLSLC